MAVNLPPPDPGSLHPVAGVELGFAEAGIRKANRRDLMLMRLAPGSVVAGVFTRNGFAAAPVQVCRRHLAAGDSFRALLVNAGNANCGTGEQGMRAALASCDLVARAVDAAAVEVLPFSTGVILEHLPVDRIEAAIPACVASLNPAHWAEAASAIMTMKSGRRYRDSVKPSTAANANANKARRRGWRGAGADMAAQACAGRRSMGCSRTGRLARAANTPRAIEMSQTTS